RIPRVVAPVREAAGVRVVAVQAGLQPGSPEPAVVIEQQVVDAVVVQRARIIRSVAKNLEIDAVVTGNAALGTEPYRSIAILHDGIDAAAGQAVSRCVAAELRRRQQTGV